MRGVPPTNINFQLLSTYKHMLERCINLLSYTEEEKKNSEFYLADSKGVPIWTDSNTISLDEESGEKEIPWTLDNYISTSNVKYRCRVKIYCVSKGS